MDQPRLDIQQASIKLVLFKSQLRSVLYGVRPFEEALLSPRSNPFGEWLATVGRSRYGTEALLDVEQAHQQLLMTARDLVSRYQRGQIQDARSYLSQIDATSEQILALLTGLEGNSRSSRPAV